MQYSQLYLVSEPSATPTKEEGSDPRARPTKSVEQERKLNSISLGDFS